MSVVMPLGQCIDRPGKPPGDLVKHCERVAAGCGRAAGSPKEKLAFLAGLCHDLAKCSWRWQHYIGGGSKKGPPHAPLGAALFMFWAESLIPIWITNRRERAPIRQLAIDWARMIDNHHGRLDDIREDPPWFGAGVSEDHQPANLLETCDCLGLDALLRKHFPEACSTLAAFSAWVDNYPKEWMRLHKERPLFAQDLNDEKLSNTLGLQLSELGAKLIFADRSDAAEWEPTEFDPADVYPALVHHARECHRSAAHSLRNGASQAIVGKRRELQDLAVQKYLAHPDDSVYSLFLPTGYGKTLTGLRVALEALRTGRCSRIIYVAPYISILSQAAKVISKATGQPVFIHHHLSILAEKPEFRYGRDFPKDDPDKNREDHQAFDLLDTWQAPIIATTFNQLFRGLFPNRDHKSAYASPLSIRH